MSVDVERQPQTQRETGGTLLTGGRTFPAARRSDGRGGGATCDQADSESAIAEEDAARAALHAFLAAFGLAAGEQRDVLVERLMRGGRARRRAAPDKSLEECALEHAEERFEAWLGMVLGTESLAGQPALPVGRAAFLACGGAASWAHLILAREPLPDAFVAAMRGAAPVLAPMPTPGTMEAQSLETWSIADAGRAAAELLDTHLAWLNHARPLLPVPIKLSKPTP